MTAVTALELFDIEMQLLLEAVWQRYGFDFRQYAPIALRRRIRDFQHRENFRTVTALTERVLHDPECLGRFLKNACLGPSSLFRDPEVYHYLRTHVLPTLRTFPFVNIWHAGCSTGEEVISMAILLEEEGLLERSRLYATDISELAIRRARSGTFPLTAMAEYEDQYSTAGGRYSLHKYCVQQGGNGVFSPRLLEKVVWSPHNLITDACFNRFQLIFCRNVLMYFNEPLQSKVHSLLESSLDHLGVLVLGKHESMRFTGYGARYRELSADLRIYQKVTS